MPESPLNSALRQFEATEANLIKIEKVLGEINNAIPTGIVFGGHAGYDENRLNFAALLKALPKIDGWKPDISLMDLDDIAQNRFDAQEVGDVSCIVAVERQIEEPGRLIGEYRHRFNQKRRELIRDSLTELIDKIDANLRQLAPLVVLEGSAGGEIDHSEFEELKQSVGQINTLLGSSVPKPARWSDLHRHMRFGKMNDLHDIIEHDWPSVKSGLAQSLYGEKDPMPVYVEDLGALVSKKPRGPVATKLLWERVAEEDFERLIFALISAEPGYENPAWLTKINASDRGRDLSVYRVHTDSLAGTRRLRVIIQCKNWQSKSVAPADIALLKEQIKMWEPPRIEVCVIATSGRFTSDAVTLIEKHNISDSALSIEMWPESHLELLLAGRPGIIAQFGLR